MRRKQFHFLAILSGLTASLQAAHAEQQSTVADMLAAGEAALFTCSGTFIAGRPLDALRRDELSYADDAPLLVAGKPPKITIDRTVETVSVPYAPDMPPMIAAHRVGLGCAILPVGAGADAVARLPKLSASRPEQTGDDHDAWIKPASSAAHQATAHRLAPVIEKAFTTGYGPHSRTIGLVVIHRDTLLAERYRAGFNARTQYRTWSMAKSIAATLVGIGIQDGLFQSVDDPVSLPEWRGQDRPPLTLEHALHMSSGLTNPDEAVPSDTLAAYWLGADSYADVGRRQPRVPPGTVWRYANYDTLLLLAALRNRMPSRQDYLHFPYHRLFDRIGMRDTIAETDFYGNFVLSSQVYTTARDLARLARLHLADGMWMGERVLPAGWARYVCTPVAISRTKDEPYGAYGAQWWLATIRPSFMGGRPLKVCHAVGFRGQFAAFIPELDLIMVRTSIDDRREDPEFDATAFFTDVVNAIAPAKPDR